MYWLGAVPAAVQCIAFLWLPESPRFLVETGKHSAARQALEHIRQRKDVDAELDAIQVYMFSFPFLSLH